MSCCEGYALREILCFYCNFWFEKVILTLKLVPFVKSGWDWLIDYVRLESGFWWVWGTLEINWWELNVMVIIGASDPLSLQVGPFYSKREHLPWESYWLWVEIS